ncbi:hypothetical protein HY417_02880 [Candidatus Kaiserbacteria bacterium]|nr:hypothetical protein [Candidatus Kaiserbacteria bacterium]
MSLYQRNERRKARRRLVIATVFVGIALTVDLASGGMVRSGARSLGSLVWSSGASVSGAVFGSGYFRSKRALSAEIESLRQALTERDASVGRLETLERENEELRVIAKLSGEVPGVVAPIISSVIASPYGTFLIGAGSASGVRVGDAVLAGSERGIVLGRIAEVRAKSALVKELFAPGERADAVVESAEFLLEGRGGGNARAEVPDTLSFAEGDLVTSPRFGNRVLGMIGAVSAGEGSGLMHIFVRAPLRTTDLRFVYVVRTLE